jgi:hypothetical protein
MPFTLTLIPTPTPFPILTPTTLIVAQGQMRALPFISPYRPPQTFPPMSSPLDQLSVPHAARLGMPSSAPLYLYTSHQGG